MPIKYICSTQTRFIRRGIEHSYQPWSSNPDVSFVIDNSYNNNNSYNGTMLYIESSIRLFHYIWKYFNCGYNNTVRYTYVVW